MATARNKILKPAGVSPDELELQVAQHIFDLEQNPELRADLRGLQITSAKEVSFEIFERPGLEWSCDTIGYDYVDVVVG